MFEAQALDLPFVADLPKREKSKVVRVWEAFQELTRISETEGIPIPQSFAARILDVSPQRVCDLANEGRLTVVQVNGTRFVTENSVVAYAKSERKAGRPLGKVLDSNESAAKIAAKLAVDNWRESRRKGQGQESQR